MNRFLALLKRFDSINNEELFPICVDQITELYVQQPIKFYFTLFHKIKDLLINKITYKRQLGAALFEKVIIKIYEKGNFMDFMIMKDKLDFEVEDFIENMQKSKRKKNAKNIEDFQKIMQIDLINFKQEQVRVHLSKKQNCLYSKCKKKLETIEKQFQRSSQNDEQTVLQQMHEKGEMDLEFTHKKKNKIQDTQSNEKHMKKDGDSSEKEEEVQVLKIKDYTTIIDEIFSLCSYLVFHQSWELRHGALMVFRSIARNINKTLFLRHFIQQNLVQEDTVITQDMFKVFTNDENKKVSISVNEDIKQKCLILLSLDRFSDFISDKSNMTNRALAVDILCQAFKNVPNLDVFFYINEILFTLNIKAGWEPKQAFVLFAKKIVYESYNNPDNNIKLISDQQIITILEQTERILLAHEEITEISSEFYIEVFQYKKDLIKQQLLEKIQQKLIEALQNTENISYMPKSIFEFFTVLSQNQKLENIIIENLEQFIKKFLFHNNKDVLQSIFVFIKTFFYQIGQDQNSKVFNIVKDQKKQFFFYAVLFYYLIENESTEDVDNILVNIVNSFDEEQTSFKVFNIYFSLLDQVDFSKTIANLDINFDYNFDETFQIDFLKVLRLGILILSKLPKDKARKIIHNFLQKESQKNYLTYIVIIQTMENQNLDESILPNYLDYLTLDQKDFYTPFFKKDFDTLIEKIEIYLAENVPELTNLNNQQLDEKINNILVNIQDRSEIKNKISKLADAFIDFQNFVSQAIKEYKIPILFKKSLIEINKNIIPTLRTLQNFLQFNVFLIKSSTSSYYLSQLLNKKQDLPKKMINNVLRPFLEIFNFPLSKFWKQYLGNSFFKIFIIYKDTEKNPLKKILSSLLNKMIDDIFLNNTYYLIENIFRYYEEKTIIKFSILDDLFKNVKFINYFEDIFLNFKEEKQKARNYYQQRLLELLENNYQDILLSSTLIQKLFIQLSIDFINNKNINMNRFIQLLYNLIEQKKEIGYNILNYLLNENKQEFIPFSKIFLKQILKCINEKLNFSKDKIFDCFTQILSLSYIGDNLNQFNTLPQQLLDEYEEGKRFLFEFKNNKNFQVDLTGIINPIEGFKLRDYQIEGIQWINFLFKYGLSGALCDDMGLGKTIQSLIATALIYKNSETKSNSLIICPNNLLYHWEQESVKYIDPKYFKSCILTKQNLQNKNLEKLCHKNTPTLFIATYHTIVKNINLFLNHKFAVIILDEAHMIKNYKSQLSQSVKQINSSLRLALTGTPIQNNVAELWSIFDFLIPLYLGSIERFRKKFRALLDLHLISVDTKKMELTTNQSQILKSLHVKVLPFIMRREKTEVLKDLPPKIIQDYDAELTDVQQKIYNKFEKEDVVMLHQQETKNGIADFKKSILRDLANLRKILNHPYTLISNLKGSQKEKIYQNVLQKLVPIKQLRTNFYLSGKFIALKSLLNSLNYIEDDEVSCIDNPQKILLFTRCNKTLDLLKNFFKKEFKYLQYLTLDNTQNPQQRNINVQNFNNKKNIKLLMLTPKIGGLGLNLSSANIVIMFDHDFNPMNDLQAMDRAHRLGQKKIVNVYRIVAKDTLEEKIMGIQKFKLSVANTIINYENTTIDNVKQSNFIEFLESFAEENQKQKNEKEENLNKNLGVLAKYLKDSGEFQEWDEDEYEKEYIQLIQNTIQQ